MSEGIIENGELKVENDLSEWREVSLGDASVEILDGDRGKNYPKKHDFSDSGYCLFLNTKNVTSSGFSFTELNFITKEKDESLRKGKLKRNDVVLTTRGTVGNVSFYDNNVKFENIRINSGMVIIRPLNIDPVFNLQLFKFLTLDLSEFTSGSAQPQLPIRDLKQIPVSIPPLPEQKAIAEVLSSLDDKIDLLHRQNKTLEQMAETLFRQWFVEEAQEDWGETTLYDAINLVGGGTPKTSNSEYWNGHIYWLSGGDISSNHKGIVISTEKHITEDGLNNSSAKLLPKYSMVISARGTVGKYCMLSQSMTFSQSNYGIKPKFTDAYFFTYLLVSYSVDELQSAAYGSVFDTITTNTFKGHPIFLPEESVIHKFDRKVTLYFEKMMVNSYQIRTLENLRDTLLPKLMSGEVRVNNDKEANQ